MKAEQQQSVLKFLLEIDIQEFQELKQESGRMVFHNEDTEEGPECGNSFPYTEKLLKEITR